MDNREQKKSKKSLWLCLVFAGGSAAIGYTAMHLPPTPKARFQQIKSIKISTTSLQAQTLVNKHLWMESKNQELAAEKLQSENQNLAPAIDSDQSARGQYKFQTGTLGTGRSSELFNEQSNEQFNDRYERNAFEDLNRYPRQYNFTNPDQIIQKQLFDSKAVSEYEELARAEYARQFVENARQHGYEIKLGPNYIVQSVKPLSMDRKPTLFEESTLRPLAK